MTKVSESCPRLMPKEGKLLFNVIFLQISPVGEALGAFLGLAGLLASLFFVYMFTKRLGIFGVNRISQWREELVASRPVRAMVNLGGLPLRWRSKSAIQPESYEQEPRFVPLDIKIPITTTVYNNIRTMRGHPEPISAILKTTSPPTLKKTSEGIFPIITEMQMLESFDHLRSINQDQKPRVVGTLHNHKDDCGLAESCEKKLSNADLLFGRKLIHIVVCPKGMRLYRSVQGSAETKAEQWK